jgi:methionyl-tRNA formyltransferase
MRKDDRMTFKKIAVLTSRESWFFPYAGKLVRHLKDKGISARLFSSHEKVGAGFDAVFMLSYFRVVSGKFISGHSHNIVVHESALPKGRGWSPLFWQILQGRNEIPIVLFEADKLPDSGKIYIKDYLSFSGLELNEEIRRKQAEKTIELCLKFIKEYRKLTPVEQRGRPTFYRKRSPEDSKLDLNKKLKDQFNLLRIVDNKEFPAFFDYKGQRYMLKIDKI